MTRLEMKQLSASGLALLVALAVGGCAHTPPSNAPSLAALAAHYGVSQDLLVKADRAGYFPESHQGRTFFCTQQPQTSSYIPKAQCFDPAQMAARLQLSAASLNDLQQRALRGGPAPRAN